MGSLLSSRKAGSSAKRTAAAAAAAAASINAQDKAVYELKVQRDRLKKFQDTNAAMVKKELEVARKLLREGQKQKAILVLRKKKYHESLIDGTFTKLANLDELVHSIRFAEMQTQVFAAMKDGNAALQALNAQMSIDDVAKLMEDSSEAIAYQEELSALLANELTADDDADAIRELEAIEEEEALNLQLPVAPQPVDAAKEAKEAATEPAEPAAEQSEAVREDAVLA